VSGSEAAAGAFGFGGGEILASVVTVLVPVLIGKAFAWWKARARERKDEMRLKAVEALEAGVAEAWERLGRAWKSGTGGAKFTDEQRSELRRVATERAVEIGRETGLDVPGIIGPALVNALISSIVRARKSSGSSSSSSSGSSGSAPGGPKAQRVSGR
jgi:hypothetical protein